MQSVELLTTTGPASLEIKSGLRHKFYLPPRKIGKELARAIPAASFDFTHHDMTPSSPYLICSPLSAIRFTDSPRREFILLRVSG